MWITYQNVEEKKGLPSRSGGTYDAWILSGIKRGFDGTPDEPYSKVIFDTTTVSVKEKGVVRRGQSLLQFLQKACSPGDTLVIKSERDGKFWRWSLIENRSGVKPAYTPLSEEQAAAILARQAEKASAPTELPSFIRPSDTPPSEMASSQNDEVTIPWV